MESAVMARSRKEQIEEMLVEEPNDPFLRYGLAMEYVSAGDDNQAVVCFRELLDRTPTYVPGYMQLGQALARLGRLDEVRTAWQGGIVQARRQNDAHAAQE